LVRAILFTNFVTNAKIIIISETSNKTSNKNAENKLLPTENKTSSIRLKMLIIISVSTILVTYLK